MTTANLDAAALKQAVKEALAESFREQRALLHDVFVEALEDVALAEAIKEGQATKLATRKEVMKVLRD